MVGFGEGPLASTGRSSRLVSACLLKQLLVYFYLDHLFIPTDRQPDGQLFSWLADIVVVVI